MPVLRSVGARALLLCCAFFGGTIGLPARVDAVGTTVGTIRRVPAQYPTIQGAVDAAAPGDLILIDGGIYRETVVVRLASLVIRGRDRTAVVIDGEGVRATGVEITADGVSLENLTVRQHREQGVLWRGVRGLRARYLTLHDNGARGIQLERAVDGVIEESYVSGASEAGIAVARCTPCQLVVRQVVVEHNGAGFAAQDATGDLYLLNSVWRHNRVGLLPHGRDTSGTASAMTTIIRGNLIHDNSNRAAPGRGSAVLGWGHGVLISGASGTLVADNVIVGHLTHGVVIAPLPGTDRPAARGNRVERNVIVASSRADIGVGGPRSQGNCIGAQQGHVTRAPVWFSCAGDRVRGIDNDLVPALTFLLRRWRLGSRIDSLPSTLILPPPLPSLPDADQAEALPTVGVFASLRPSLDRIVLPAGADSIRREAAIAGTVPDGTPRVGAFLAAFQELVPLSFSLVALVLILLAAWRAGIVWRARRGHTGRKARRAWRAAVLATVAWIGLAVAVAVSFSGV
jgi:hypothetical protein